MAKITENTIILTEPKVKYRLHFVSGHTEDRVFLPTLEEDIYTSYRNKNGANPKNPYYLNTAKYNLRNLIYTRNVDSNINFNLVERYEKIENTGKVEIKILETIKKGFFGKTGSYEVIEND